MRDEGRLVVLAGPAKTGSTHVQSSIIRIQQQLKAQGWLWPSGVVPGRPSTDKSFSGFVSALIDFPRCHFSLRATPPRMTPHESEDCTIPPFTHCAGSTAERAAFASKSNRQVEEIFKANFASASPMNLVIASEDFPRLACAAFNHSLKRFAKLVAPRRPEFVLTLRTPHLEHWRSGFHQDQAARILPSNLAFPAWICNRLASQFMWPSQSPTYDPLGAALLISRNGAAVDVIDASGVATAGLDITDPIFCSVLGIDCNGSEASPWSNTTRSARENSRRYDASSSISGLSKSVDGLLEDLFQARDCVHWSQLATMPHVRLHLPSAATVRMKACGDAIRKAGQSHERAIELISFRADLLARMYCSADRPIDPGWDNERDHDEWDWLRPRR